MSASLERRAFSLGTANAIDYALQFLLPIVLTRALSPEDFGRYRLLWLAIGTLMTLAPLFMPQSLYYFLPRADRETKRLYINQTLFFLLSVGTLAAWAVSQWNPFLPHTLEHLVAGNFPVVPVFVLLWIVASLLDVLPTVDERVAWQARAIIGLSATRTIALGAVAMVTHDFVAVIETLAIFTAFKLLVLLGYIAHVHGLGRPWLRRASFAGQLRHAAPFGFSGALYGLRTQADQWIAATLFSVSMFASFSVAAVLGPMVNLFRQSVNHVFLPSMSRMHSRGDFTSMLALNSRANAMVALLVYPALAFAFVFAEPLISLVYTPTYVAAVPVLRLYVVGLVAFVVELNSILLLLRQGAFAARVNALALAVSVALSFAGAMEWGLVGAAAGSVAMIHAERLISLTRIARLTNVPLARLQDWNCLSAILIAAAAAATLAGIAMPSLAHSHVATLAGGAAVLAIVYPVALCLLGQRALLAGLFASVLAPEGATGA